MSRVVAKIKVGSRIMWTERGMDTQQIATMIFTGNVRAIRGVDLEVVDVTLHNIEFSKGIQGQFALEIKGWSVVRIDNAMSLDDVRYKR